jgi:hypothetical protein
MLQGYSLPRTPKGTSSLAPTPPWHYVGTWDSIAEPQRTKRRSQENGQVHLPIDQTTGPVLTTSPPFPVAQRRHYFSETPEGSI